MGKYSLEQDNVKSIDHAILIPQWPNPVLANT
jgi:hypothetical protein